MLVANDRKPTQSASGETCSNGLRRPGILQGESGFRHASLLGASLAFTAPLSSGLAQRQVVSPEQGGEGHQQPQASAPVKRQPWERAPTAAFLWQPWSVFLGSSARV